MRKAPGLYLIAVASCTGVYFFLPTGAQSLLYDLVALSAAAALLFGTFRHPPDAQVAWLVLGLGVLTLSVGDVVFGEGQPVPSLADMFYISSYPLLGLGLIGLAPWRGTDRTGLDLCIAVVISLTVGFVSWAFLILPSADTDQASLAARLVAVGYPVMDVVLLGFLVRAARPWRFSGSPLRFVCAAFLLFLCADSLYAVQNFGADYELGSVLDAAWLLAYGCLGAALLHPGAERVWLDPDQWSAGPIARPVPTPVRTLTETVVRTEAAPVIVRRSAAQAVRFALIVLWSGRMLFALGVSTMFLGAAWMASDVVILAGAYATSGAFMWMAGSRNPRFA